MLATVDLQGVQSASAEPAPLQALLQQLVGQPFLHFRFSYGDELTVHFGQPQPYSSPKLAHLVKGSYVLGARASRWYLRSESPPLVILDAQEAGPHFTNGFKGITAQDLEASALVQRGARVVFAGAFSLDTTGAAALGFGLSLSLSDGSSLLIVPASPEEGGPADAEIADWELFTPYERFLRVGPRAIWSYLPSGNAPQSQSASSGSPTEE